MSSRRLRLRWVGVGDESEDFLREAAKVAEHCRRGVGDLNLTHWSAMIWGDIGGSALALRSPGASPAHRTSWTSFFTVALAFLCRPGWMPSCETCPFDAHSAAACSDTNPSMIIRHPEH